MSELKRALSKALRPVYTTIVVLFLIALIVGIPALILASIAFTNSNNLSDTKQDNAPFNTWNTTNGTLYKNSYIDNVVLIPVIPVLWSQIGKQVLLRLPFIKVDDTLTGPLNYTTLHIPAGIHLPFIQGDNHPWGASSSVTVGSAVFNVNSNVDNREGEIFAIQLGAGNGQGFIYDFVASQNGLSVAPNAAIVIRGLLTMYETTSPLESSAVDLSLYTLSQITQSISNGGALPDV